MNLLTRKLLLICFFLVANFSLGQSLSSIQFEDSETDEIVDIAERTDIRTRTIDAISGVSNGYHMIANTFSKNKYRKRFEADMKDKGFPAYHFKNPDENYTYVSLKHYTNWEDAAADYDSQMNGEYTDDLWILIVNADRTNQETASLEKIQGSKGQIKLIDKANEYFETMRYAEASKYYDMALKSDLASYPKDILQKAGDAYYFNSNMEKAHQYYEALYENHGEDISADNVFKYAHALKGNSKYGKAKRMMRLYKRKVEDEKRSITAKGPSREAILDGILNSSVKAEVKSLSINSVYSDF